MTLAGCRRLKITYIGGKGEVTNIKILIILLKGVYLELLVKL